MVESDQGLGALAAAFKEGVELKDRKYHMKTYQQCFVGSEAVDYLLNSGEASNREDAVQIGRALEAMHLFEHCTRDHQFSDDYLFFRFLCDVQRGSLKIDEATGKKIEWSKFFAPLHGDGVHDMQPSFSQGDLVALADIDPKDNRVISKVWPLDAYNTKLLDHVHPPDWQDPQVDVKDTYDLVVIGAGVGGLVSAAGAAGVGAKVAMIEAHMLGGDCLNVGCVPSKALIHSATMAHRLTKDNARLEEAGIFVDPNAVKVDFDKVMERVRKIRCQIGHHDSATRYSKALGVEVFIGYGKFTSPKSVEVNGQTLNFKKAIIATGGYPALIPMEGLKELHDQTTSTEFNPAAAHPLVMTNETFFNMTKQPKHLVVIGAGMIGMELSQAMQRLGTQTIVLGRSGRVLPKEDDDMAEIVKQQMIDDGVTFRLSVKEYVKIELTGYMSESGNPEMAVIIMENGASEPTTLLCDAVLVAAGRLANVTGMDLEKANVKYTPEGLVVNDKLQTTNSKVYGVGDVCSKFKFTHAADFMARAVIRNSLFFGKEKMSNLLIPYATFTSPEIASVGLYGNDLEKKGIEYKVIEKHFKDNDRSICDDTTQGLVRFRVDAKKDKILGATIVGEGAANMISEVTLAMQSETGLGSLASVIHPYPTTAEVLRQSGDVYNKQRLTTTVKILLRGLVQMQK
jgi:pyruvate/2-oxoglutarate dehydrogenase complex dihydrolipoamide dehydrogenase (E3) component